jgi:hypothetical protein
MAVVAGVLGIVLFVAMIQAAIWIPLARRWKRRSREAWAAFDASLGADEVVIIPRERGWYRGSTGGFSQARGNAQLVLTSKRLFCCKVTGAVVELPVERVVGSHLTKWFQGSRVGGREHLVLELDDHSEIAYFVDNNQEWLDRLEAIRGT